MSHSLEDRQTNEMVNFVRRVNSSARLVRNLGNPRARVARVGTMRWKSGGKHSAEENFQSRDGSARLTRHARIKFHGWFRLKLPHGLRPVLQREYKSRFPPYYSYYSFSSPPAAGSRLPFFGNFVTRAPFNAYVETQERSNIYKFAVDRESARTLCIL